MEDNLTKLEREVDRLLKERSMLISVLNDAYEYIEDQSDVADGPEGMPVANRAMSIVMEMDRVFEWCGV